MGQNLERQVCELLCVNTLLPSASKIQCKLGLRESQQSPMSSHEYIWDTYQRLHCEAHVLLAQTTASTLLPRLSFLISLYSHNYNEFNALCLNLPKINPWKSGSRKSKNSKMAQNDVKIKFLNLEIENPWRISDL